MHHKACRLFATLFAIFFLVASTAQAEPKFKKGRVDLTTIEERVIVREESPDHFKVRVASRVQQYRHEWQEWNLTAALKKLFGGKFDVELSEGKVIYTTRRSPFLLIEDPNGHYFRVASKRHRKLKKRTGFIDRNGNIPSAVQRSRYEALTHFRYRPPKSEVDILSLGFDLQLCKRLF